MASGIERPSCNYVAGLVVMCFHAMQGQGTRNKDRTEFRRYSHLVRPVKKRGGEASRHFKQRQGGAGSGTDQPTVVEVEVSAAKVEYIQLENLNWQNRATMDADDRLVVGTPQPIRKGQARKARKSGTKRDRRAHCQDTE